MRRLAPGFRFRDLRPKAESDRSGTLKHVAQPPDQDCKPERLNEH
jgi:hypothetical protein